MSRGFKIGLWLAVLGIWALVVVCGVTGRALVRELAVANQPHATAPTIVRFHVYNDDEDIDQGADDLPDQDAQPVPEDSPPAPYSDSSNI